MFVDVPMSVQTPPNMEANDIGIKSLLGLSLLVAASPSIWWE
jgi:hypothetical protein